MTDLISREDLAEITGAMQPARICQRLREEGIRFVTRYDGWPSLTWEAYNRQLCANDSNKKTEDGFNLSNM